MIGNNQTSNKTKDKLILSPIRRETELFLVGAKCEGVWRGRGQARNEEGNMIVITEDYVPFFFFHRKTNGRFAQEPCVRHWTLSGITTM